MNLGLPPTDLPKQLGAACLLACHTGNFTHEFCDGRNGVARCSCVNTGGGLQKPCMLPGRSRQATWPGQSPYTQAGTKTKDLLTLTTTTCLLQTNQTPSAPRRGGAHTFKQAQEGKRKY